MSGYQAAFFIVPARIMNLPHLTISFLKVYETIFQFWNHGKACFLSDKAMMERTGVCERTMRNALIFFEQHGELKREKKGTKRYLTQPTLSIETDPPNDEPPVDNSSNNCTETVPTGNPLPEHRQILTGITGKDLPHNKKNYNPKKVTKSFCKSKDQKINNEKRHDWATAKIEVRQTAKEWGPGHPTWDSMHATKSKHQ